MAEHAGTLRDVRERLAGALLMLDFDGTLAPIVSMPELAEPIPGTREVLERLRRGARRVVILTGRPRAEVLDRIGLPSLEVLGLYGAERDGDAPAASDRGLVAAVAAAIEGVEGVRIEAKGAGVAVHHRDTTDPETAPALGAVLARIAADRGLDVRTGKKVFELVPAGAPTKADTVHRLLRETPGGAALYAGDDDADVDAMRALRSVRHERATLAIGVDGAEAPAALHEVADVVVEDPRALVAMLGGLVSPDDRHRLS